MEEGSRAFDRQSFLLISKTLLLALAVGALDLVLRPIGAWRLPIDVAVYGALGVALSVINVRALRDMARAVLTRGAPPVAK